MVLSVFDIFKIGIGPSSSHTVGPMIAAARFTELLAQARPDGCTRLRVWLYGSLAATGKGHATDRALCLGLCGAQPETLEPDEARLLLETLERDGSLDVPGLPPLAFSPQQDIVFERGRSLAQHPNGMTFCAVDAGGNTVLEQTYFSIGGGAIRTLAEMAEPEMAAPVAQVPYAFGDARTMLELAAAAGHSISEMMRANEDALRPACETDVGLKRIWDAMNASIDRGLLARGELPGGLRVRRRASQIHEQLTNERDNGGRLESRDWLAVYAMAVNEENSVGNRVVTAPTNGAAGVVPAVLRYHLQQTTAGRPTDVTDFLLVAAAIGSVIKSNASISGAEVGCQGEIGSASAMAAAGLCAVLGGTNAQIETAAEMALEHHLGMTCDPVGGLVQIPCIERNAFGAIKAVTAATLAMRSDGQHVVSLDSCIRTMYQTGLDMNAKYKETSAGGLAVNVVEC